MGFFNTIKNFFLSLYMRNHTRINNSPYPEEHVKMAMSMVKNHWFNKQGASKATRFLIEERFNNLRIDFVEELYYNDERYSGLAFYPEYGQLMNVKVGYFNDAKEVIPIYQSALIHELFHVVLFVLNNDSDGDHEHGSGPWTSQMNIEINDLMHYLKLAIDLKK
jgi:hypothetical protein